MEMERSWATKRKLTIISIIGAAVFVVGAGTLFFLLYEPPTCFDGTQNQDETGVDCGGSCQAVCSAEVSRPLVRWSRVFPVTEGQYNLVALIENPNSQAYGENWLYRFRVYDRNNFLFRTVTGRTSIPAGREFAVFEGSFDFDREPARTTFQFTAEPSPAEDTPSWLRPEDRPEQFLRVSGQQFVGPKSASPRVQARLENTGTQPIESVEAVAVVLDPDGHAIGASRTVVDRLVGGQSESLTFTWPEPFDAGTRIRQRPVTVMLVLDRSGSMAADQAEPPQPLTKAKEAAVAFVDLLTPMDHAGMVSFATQASSPVDVPLAGDLGRVKNGIEDLTIRSTGKQYTNIAGALTAAHQEVKTHQRSEDAVDIVVFMTDGIANRPLPPDGGEPEEYASAQALQASGEITEGGVELFVIGLGDEVDEDFLRQLSPSAENYFFAPSAEDLRGVYEDIATMIDERAPAAAKIYPRVRR